MKTKTTMNVRFLRRVQKAILKHPGQFLMNSYFSHYLDNNEPAEGCGTAACIAGWALHCVGGGKKTLKRTWSEIGNYWNTDFRKLAAQHLSLSKRQSERLFYECEWPGKYRLGSNNKENAKLAAARIDHFIKTKGME